VGFVGKGSTDFRPSISLATEEVEEGLSLSEYMKAVKSIQLADKNQYRDLGKFAMEGGKGRLIEITSTGGWGTIKMLQAILLKNNTVYILTGSTLKEDFLKLQPKLIQSFRTLKILPNLWTPIANADQKERFENLLTSLGSANEKETEWKNFQTEIESLSSLGPYWQFLSLQEGKSRLSSHLKNAQLNID